MNRDRKQVPLSQKTGFKRSSRFGAETNETRSIVLTHGVHSNFPAWKKHTVKSMEKTYGDSARFTEQDPDVVDPKEHYWMPVLPSAVGCPSDEEDDLEIEDDERAAMRKEVFKQKALMAADRTKIFADLQIVLSRESLDVVKRHRDWDACLKARCPAHLWQIIVSTHAVRADNYSEVVVKSQARVSYNSLKQFSGESLVAYRERSEATYNSYCLAGNQPLGDDIKAMDFFTGLDDQRHAEFKRLVKNLFASGEREDYENVMEVFNHVNSYTPSRVTPYHVTKNATVYHAKDGGRTNKGSRKPIGGSSSSCQENRVAKDMSKVKCYGCDEYGHYKNKCPRNRVLCVTRVLSTTQGLFDKCCSTKIQWYEVVLDSGATVSVMNPRVLKDVYECDPISITGVTSSPLVLDKMGSLGGVMAAYCSNEVTGNILSLSEVQNKYKVRFDSGNSCFKVYLKDGTCIFFKLRCGLYIADMSNLINNCNSTVLAVLSGQSDVTNDDSDNDVPPLIPCDSNYDDDVDVDHSRKCYDECMNDPDVLCDDEQSVVYDDELSDEDSYCLGYYLPCDDTSSSSDVECDDVDDRICDGDMSDLKFNNHVLSICEPIEQLVPMPGWGFPGFNKTVKSNDGWSPIVTNGLGSDTIEDLQPGEKSFYKVIDPVGDTREAVSVFHARHISGDSPVVLSTVHSQSVDSNDHVVLSTVYSPRQLKQAEAARQLLHQAGYPSYLELQKMVRSGNFIGSNVTSQDVAIASKIYGTAPAAVRGKFTKKAVSSTPTDPTLISQPSVQVLSVDIIYVGNQPFLIGLSNPLSLLLSNAVVNETAETLQQGMLDMFSVLRARDFVVTKVEMEPSRAMSNLEYNLGPGVSSNVTGAGDHLPALDVRIRRLKETIRATLTHVNFNIPKSKIMFLVNYAVSRMNYRQTSSRSDNSCPYVAFTGRLINRTRDLGLVFGDSCECAVPSVISNDAMSARTSSHIAMCPTGNQSGS